MKPHIFLLGCFLSNIFFTKGQVNLVKNPSFEDTLNSCPWMCGFYCGSDGITSCKDWSSLDSSNASCHSSTGWFSSIALSVANSVPGSNCVGCNYQISHSGT